MAEVAEGKVVGEAEKKKQEQSLAYYELFSFADRFDALLMAAGSLGAVVHGSAMPVFFLLFGDLVNGFGKNQTNLSKMTAEVSKVCPPSLVPGSPLHLHRCISEYFSYAALLTFFLF